jgi:hypothetical protein
LIARLEGYQKEINGLAFSCDGARIVSSSNDDAVRVWDTSNWNCLLVIESRVDAATVAAGQQWWAARTETETVILSPSTETGVAWLPAALESLVAHSGCIWAGVVKRTLITETPFYVFCLEMGAPSDLLGREGFGLSAQQDAPEAQVHDVSLPLPLDRPAAEEADYLLSQVKNLLDEDRPEDALDLLWGRGGSSEPFLRNAKGVCRLRMGETSDAIETFGALALASRGRDTDLLPEAPTVFKTNFATALVRAHAVSRCVKVLNKIGDEQNATVQKLRAAIKRWEESLTFWQRLQWHLGIRPKRRVVLGWKLGDLF